MISPDSPAADRFLASPNHGARIGVAGPSLLILHYTGMDSEERALKWLRDPESSVSAHYFVFEDGRIAQLVDEADRAWHAGRSHWAGETDINSRSIGIEIANPGHEYGYRVFPGVHDVLARVQGRAGVGVGLGTGNVKRGAYAKLAPGDLGAHFAFGGFGCDAEDRAEVLRSGARRGAESPEG